MVHVHIKERKVQKMANFVLNVASGENHFSQWQQYLQQREFFTDVTSAIQSQTKAYRTESNRVSAALEKSVASVVGELTQGFSGLSGDISQIGTSLNQLATMVDWRLAEMIDQYRISNLLLENVGLLLRIP